VSVSKRQLIFSLAGLLLVLCLLDRAVAWMARESYPRRLMSRLRETPGAQVLALGNSVIGTGIVEASLDESLGLGRENGTINLGMGASWPVEHLLMLRYALGHGLRPRVVVYGFYDFQLTHPVELATRDLIGNNAMLYYVEPEYARTFYRLSLHDRIEFQIMRYFEIFADRGAVWLDVERWRRAISQQGMPPEKTSALGRANDFTLLEYPSASAFLEECGRASQLDLIPPVREIVRQASSAGSRVVFVEMPMPPAHVHSFYDSAAWAGYEAHVRGLLDGLGVSYVDASHWMPEESSFEDPLHMTYEGAQRFSRRLGEYIRAAPPTQ